MSADTPVNRVSFQLPLFSVTPAAPCARICPPFREGLLSKVALPSTTSVSAEAVELMAAETVIVPACTAPVPASNVSVAARVPA